MKKITPLFKSTLVSFVSAFILAGFSAPLSALHLDVNIRGLHGYGGLGIQSLDVSDFNSRLKAGGLGTVADDPYFQGSLGGFLYLDSVMLGLQGDLLGQRFSTFKKDGQSYTQALNGTAGFGRAGYAVVDSEHFRITPFGALGIGSTHWIISRNTSPDFDGVMSQPQRGGVYSQFNLLVQAGVQMTFRFEVLKLNNHTVGLFGGIIGAYTVSVYNAPWVSIAHQSGTIDGGPDITWNGFQAMLIGGAYLRL